MLYCTAQCLTPAICTKILVFILCKSPMRHRCIQQKCLLQLQLFVVKLSIENVDIRACQWISYMTALLRHGNVELCRLCPSRSNAQSKSDRRRLGMESDRASEAVTADLQTLSCEMVQNRGAMTPQSNYDAIIHEKTVS